MTREETIKLLAMIKTAYPNSFKNLSKQEAEQTVDLWQEMFNKQDVNIVLKATKEWINDEKFCPTIADIKIKITKIKDREARKKWAEMYDN